MIRKNFYIGVEQNNFLESLKTLSVSEHIRRAIDEYIEKKQQELRTVQVSASISKKGGKHGDSA